MQPGTRIALHRVGGEVLELGERLEAGVTAADEDVGEQLVAAGRILARVGRLERLDHVVAQPDRVGQALEADRVLGESWHWQHPRDRAKREQELVVGKLLDFAVASAQLDRACLGIMTEDRAEPQVGPIEDLAQRRHHMARLHVPAAASGKNGV